MTGTAFLEQQHAWARTATTRRHVAESGVIEAPLITVWEIVRDFGAGERWLPGVAATEVEPGAEATTVGARRRLVLANGSSTREQLVGLSDVRHVAEVAVLETSMPVSNYVATWSLSPITESEHTLMSWSVEFDGIDDGFPELAKRLRTQIFRAGFARLREAAASRTSSTLVSS